MEWYFSQMKGTIEEEINEADIISCLEFDETGEFIATGDKGGRIVVFRRNHNISGRVVDYGVHCTFTSHEPEFDYLKSLEIEEKINKIKWLPQCNESRFLLSTNDKTIKLWRITERFKRPVNFNFIGGGDFNYSLNSSSGNQPKILGSGLDRYTCSNEIRIPYYQMSEPVVEATPRRIFSNAHAYHINSISINSDQDTFLSADDLRINIWNLQLTNQSFNIVDIKPTNMEDLTEVITAAQFHPTSCSLLIYSSSKGTIRLCDMRERALCDNNAILFEEPDDSTSRSFFSEIISSISDINFSHSGRYILSRDYLTLKVWDMNMAKSPVASYPVHDYLRLKLCALYENDCIFDKFECCWSPDDKHVLTGSYNNFFRIFERNTSREVTLEVGRDLLIACERRPLAARTISAEGGYQRRPGEVSVECMDFQHRLLHLAWHPRINALALAATNNLYILESDSSDITTGTDVQNESIACSSTSLHNTVTVAPPAPPAHSVSTTTTTSSSGYSSGSISGFVLPPSSLSIDDRMMEID